MSSRASTISDANAEGSSGDFQATIDWGVVGRDAPARRQPAL
jgi:hypothetical protein